MHNPPKGVDLKFSSFGKKPAFTTLGKKQKSKYKYRPGGEWAEEPQTDDLDFGSGNGDDFFGNPNKAKNEPTLDNEVDFGVFNDESNEKQEQVSKPKKKKGSKFSFIKKDKQKKFGKSGKKEKKEQGLMEAMELKGDKYAYPRKIVNSIVEPIGARKKPSESVLQNFIKQTANFDPRIILSILYHSLGEEGGVWLSKYRGLIALEALLVRNTDYKDKMVKLETEFVERVNGVCEGEQFTQRSHQQLVKKAKDSVLKLIQGSEVQANQSQGFDFGKMNEMMSKMEKEKTTKNGNFLDKMNKIKKKLKKDEPENKTDMILDLDFGNNDLLTQKPSSNVQQVKPKETNSDNLFDLDFGVTNNNNTDEGFSNPLNNNTQPPAQNQNFDFFDLDVTTPGQAVQQTKPQSTPAPPKTTDYDFL
jgi:hypothetical protein